MLAQLIGHLPFWQIYGILLVASLGFLFALSFLFYLPLYKSALREPAFTWKTQLRWPSDATIRREIFWAVVGACFAVLNPAFAIWLQVRRPCPHAPSACRRRCPYPRTSPALPPLPTRS